MEPVVAEFLAFFCGKGILTRLEGMARQWTRLPGDTGRYCTVGHEWQVVGRSLMRKPFSRRPCQKAAADDFCLSPESADGETTYELTKTQKEALGMRPVQ